MFDQGGIVPRLKASNVMLLIPFGRWESSLGSMTPHRGARGLRDVGPEGVEERVEPLHALHVPLPPWPRRWPTRAASRWTRARRDVGRQPANRAPPRWRAARRARSALERRVLITVYAIAASIASVDAEMAPRAPDANAVAAKRTPSNDAIGVAPPSATSARARRGTRRARGGDARTEVPRGRG